jgi:dihydrofolate reductase
VINIIAAMDRNRNIGLNGDMPWGRQVPSDLRRFKELTTGSPVVMGRKTYESIGHALPGRTNIVMTRSIIGLPESIVKEGCLLAKSVEDVISMKKLMLEDVQFFIIGGAEIYKQFMPYADRIYLTKILANLEGDTTFPSIIGNWRIYQEPLILQAGDKYSSQYITYERVREE